MCDRLLVSACFTEATCVDGGCLIFRSIIIFPCAFFYFSSMSMSVKVRVASHRT